MPDELARLLAEEKEEGADEGQTVHVAVEVGTQAADAADGDQVIEAGKAKVCLLYTSRCV